MLERHELEAFLTLAEELHFGHTAERLHVSTARVSQTIRKLERRVGVCLFNRTSRRVELSAVGRQLYEDIKPAWTQIGTAFQRAIDTGRGIAGTLRIAFTSAAAGQLLVGATEVLRNQQPDYDVQIREAQPADVLPWLRDGDVDIVLTTFPVSEPDIVMGPVLVREARMLAVPSGHPYARQASVSVQDLTLVKVLQLAGSPPDAWRDNDIPSKTPTGAPVEPDQSARTLQEILTLVGAGRGVFPVGAQTRRYYPRPDVAYIPFHDAPPLDWGLISTRQGTLRWPLSRTAAPRPRTATSSTIPPKTPSTC